MSRYSKIIDVILCVVLIYLCVEVGDTIFQLHGFTSEQIPVGLLWWLAIGYVMFFYSGMLWGMDRFK